MPKSDVQRDTAISEFAQTVLRLAPHPPAVSGLAYLEVQSIVEKALMCSNFSDTQSVVILVKIVCDLFVISPSIEIKTAFWECLQSLESRHSSNKSQKIISKAALAVVSDEELNLNSPGVKKLTFDLLGYMMANYFDFFSEAIKVIIRNHSEGKIMCLDFYANLQELNIRSQHSNLLANIQWIVHVPCPCQSTISLVRLLTVHSHLMSFIGPADLIDIFAEACHALKTFDQDHKVIILNFMAKLPKPFLRKHLMVTLDNEEFNIKISTAQEAYAFSMKGALLNCLENELSAIRLTCLRILAKFSSDQDFSLLIKLSRLLFYFYNDEDLKIRMFAMSVDLRLKKSSLRRNIDIDILNLKDKVYHYEYLAHDKTESIRCLSYKLLSLIKYDFEEGLVWFYKTLDIFQQCLDQRRKQKDESLKIKKAFLKLLKTNSGKFGKIFIEKCATVVKSTLMNFDGLENRGPLASTVAVLYFLDVNLDTFLQNGFHISEETKSVISHFLNAFFSFLRQKSLMLITPPKPQARTNDNFFAEPFESFLKTIESEGLFLQGSSNCSELITNILSDFSQGLVKYFQNPIKAGQDSQLELYLLMYAKKSSAFKLAYLLVELSDLHVEGRQLLENLLGLVIALHSLKVHLRISDKSKSLHTTFTELVKPKFKKIFDANLITPKLKVFGLMAINESASLMKTLTDEIGEAIAKIKTMESTLRRSTCKLKRVQLSLHSPSKMVCSNNAFETMKFKAEFKKSSIGKLPLKMQKTDDDGHVYTFEVENDASEGQTTFTFSQNQRIFFKPESKSNLLVSYTLVRQLSDKLIYPVSNEVSVKFINSATRLSPH